MIAFHIDIFCVCAFGAISDKAQGFKSASIRLRNVAVVDVDNGVVRDPLGNGGEIGLQGLGGNALIQMSGEAFYRIDLFGLFMEPVYDVSQQTAAGSVDAICHVGGEFTFRLGKASRKFI